jgi:Nucleotide modification associated domain 3
VERAGNLVRWKIRKALRKATKSRAANVDMPRIYLVNIGANTAHQKLARCPIFDDGSFVYVSFPDEEGRQKYPKTAQPFLFPKCSPNTHLDPDWNNLTYGDNCKNPRARALLQAKPNDIFLFWALLWKSTNENWTEDRGWYFIGAIRIEEILEAGDPITKAKFENQERAKNNAHVFGNQVVKNPGRIDRVFIGFKDNSILFPKAIDLEIGKDDGLFQKTVRTADRKKVNWNEPPRWNSVTRSCRAVWDLEVLDERQRANLVCDAIRRKNPNFDLLTGL